MLYLPPPILISNASATVLENHSAIKSNIVFSEDSQVVFSTSPYVVVEADSATVQLSSDSSSSLILDAYSRNDGQILRAKNDGVVSFFGFRDVSITTNSNVLYANSGEFQFDILGSLALQSTAASQYIIRTETDGSVEAYADSISVTGGRGIQNKGTTVLEATDSVRINATDGIALSSQSGSMNLVGGQISLTAGTDAINSTSGGTVNLKATVGDLAVNSGSYGVTNNNGGTVALSAAGDLAIVSGAHAILNKSEAGTVSLEANNLTIGSDQVAVHNTSGTVKVTARGTAEINSVKNAVYSSGGQVLLHILGDEGLAVTSKTATAINAVNASSVTLGDASQEIKKFTVVSGEDDSSYTHALYAGSQSVIQVTAQSSDILSRGTGSYGVYAYNGTVLFNKSDSSGQTLTVTSENARGINSNSGKIDILADSVTVNSALNGIYAQTNSEITLGSADDPVSTLTVTTGNGYGISSSASAITISAVNSEIISQEQENTNEGATQPYGGTGIFAINSGTVSFLDTGNENQKITVDSRWGALFAQSGGTIDIASGSADLTGSVLATTSGSVILGSQKALSELSITVEDGNTGADEAAVNARTGSITINAEKAEINSSKTAILATGQGSESADSSVSINVSESLTVNGDISAAVHRDGDSALEGNRSIVINDAAEGSVVVNGNILTESNGSETVSAIVLNLKSEDSVLNGAVIDTDRSSSLSDSNGGTELNLFSGAAWNVSGDSSIKTINSENGIINTSGNNLTIDSLSNSGLGTTISTSSVQANQISINQNYGEGLTVVLQSEATDALPGDSEGNQAAMEAVVSVANSDSSYSILAEEGTVVGTSVLIKNSDGTSSYSEQVNTVTQGLEDISAMNFLMFRSQMNDLQKRMGDLRIMPKESGAWVRYYGGQNKYGSSNLKNKYNTLQLGADYRIADNFILGGTFSYTDDNGTLKNGSSDGKQYSFGLYGGWLADNGQYVDVIVKRHRIKTEYNLTNLSGVLNTASYYNWGTTVSAEYGWRLGCPSTGFYVEPQAEFSIGHLDGVKYHTNQGVSVHQKTIKSVVGRVGTAVGYVFPENKGSVYAKASVLHDWNGKAEGTLRYKGQKTSYRDDLGGTWGEFAVGGTYNAGKHLSTYGEIQTTAGSPIRNPWQISVGLRYSF